MAVLCKDCRWVQRGWFGRVRSMPQCLRPTGTDLVHGAVIRSGYYASTERACVSEDRCGPDARHFEPRTPAQGEG